MKNSRCLPDERVQELSVLCASSELSCLQRNEKYLGEKPGSSGQKAQYQSPFLLLEFQDPRKSEITDGLSKECVFPMQ